MSDITIWEAAGANGGGKADLEILKVLVGQGESVNQPNWAGCTPLHCAAPEGNRAILEFLVQQGADVNKTTPYGLTPLHFACYYGRLENVQLLLAHGANIGARTHDGYTPKYKAMEGQKGGRAKGPGNRFQEVIDLLTQCEANPQLPVQAHAVAPLPPTAPPATCGVPPQPTLPPAVPVPDTEGPMRACLDQLEGLIRTHRQACDLLTGPGKEESFQRMLRDLMRVSAQYERKASSPAPIPTPSSGAPQWIPPAPMAVPPPAQPQPPPPAAAAPPPQHPVAPAPYQPSPPPPQQYNPPPPQHQYNPPPQQQYNPPPAQQQYQQPPPQQQHQQPPQQQYQPAPQQLQQYAQLPQLAASETKLVPYETPKPDPNTDYYTQQYQRYLEHAKAGAARSTAVFSGDYFSSGAQTARAMFPAQPSYNPYAQAAAQALPRTSAAPSQPSWNQYTTAYQPPQHPTYSGAPTFASPIYAYNPYGPAAAGQPARWQ